VKTKTVKTTPAFEELRKQHEAIQRGLYRDEGRHGWAERPDADGWWLWREGGRLRTELILLAVHGRVVADDDEYTAASGLEDKNDGFEFNYWAGTDTHTMPGVWLKL
jgi:hypothetical protein